MFYLLLCFFFFFQAEDGIRDRDVTGVQTCALPIFHRRLGDLLHLLARYQDARHAWERAQADTPAEDVIEQAHLLRKIGNAFRDEYRYEDARRAYDAAEAALPPVMDLRDERTAPVWAQIQLER